MNGCLIANPLAFIVVLNVVLFTKHVFEMNFNGQSEPKGGQMVGSPKTKTNNVHSEKSIININRLLVSFPTEIKSVCRFYKLSASTLKLIKFSNIISVNNLHSLIKHHLCMISSNKIISTQVLSLTPVLQLQSGFINEKQMNRSLYSNSKKSKDKAKNKQKLSDLVVERKKRPKDPIINHKIKTLIDKMEIQVGIKDLFVSRDISCHIENFVSYITAIRESNSILQFICITNIFLGCYFSTSRVSEIISFFHQLFASEPYLETESGDMQFQSVSMCDIKLLLSSFKELRHSESAKKLYKFVSYILALGLCESNSLKFSIGKFELFHVACEQKNTSFIDLIEMIFEIVIYFVERGYQVFATGDPWQLLYGDNKLIEFEKKFSYVNSFINIVESGNLELLPESVDSFEDKVIELKEEILIMLKDNPSGSYRQVLVIKLNTIDKINVRLLQARKNVSIREKPFSFLLFGASSVGKSAMTNIILNQLMQVNGFEPDPKKINSLNASDQYQSDYRSDATCVIFDDLANATLQTAKGNHCQLIIDFINNNPKCALKAGVEEKGACFIRPKIVVGTTNVKTLLAHQYSNEPVSIVRRFDVTISVTVKPEYVQAGSHMIDPEKIPIGCKDCWLFDVEKVMPVSRGEGATMGIGYVPVKYNGIVLKQIGMKLLLQYLSDISKKHFALQKELVRDSHSIFTTSLCANCHQYDDFCTCLQTQVNPFEKTISEMFSFKEKEPVKNNMFVPPWFNALSGLNDTICQAYDKSKMIVDFISNIEQYTGFDNIYLFHTYIQENFPILTYVLIWPILIVLCLLGLMTSSSYIFFFFILSCVKFLRTFNWFCEMKLSLFALKENSLVLLRKYDTSRNRKYLKIGILGVVSVVSLKKIYDLLRTYNMLKIQGSDYVTPEPSINEKPQNEWKKPFLSEIPKSTKSWTTTSTALKGMVAQNLAYFEGTNTATGKSFFCNAFPLKSNVWLINTHALPEDAEIRGKFIRHDTSMHGGNFTATISPALSVNIPETDISLIYVPAGGDNKDFTPYFPIEEVPKRIPAMLIYKDSNANVTVQNVNAKYDIVGTNDIQVPGYGYTTEMPTHKGLCMATLIADNIGPVILGFHFAGSSGKHIGASSMVTQKQLEEACYILAQRPSVILSHNTGDLILRDLGPYKNVQLMEQIHDHSPLCFQPEGAVFRAYGKHNGARKTYKSSVLPTLISDSVTEIMGQPNIWGPPPNIKGWETWQRDMSNMTHSKSLCPTLLVCAAKDYEMTINNKISQERFNRISPLSDDSALSGADGVYGIDSVNMKSSCGAPINKPKNKVLFRSDTPIKGISQPIIAPDYIWEEVRRLEQVLLKKERVYLQFTACLKDEPTKVTKLKTRVFCGSPIAATILIRKFYLPFCKLIMENTSTFECAVGINAHGPEWNELAQIITKFGIDRMVAGDYADYDSTMPASIMFAAFKIIINMARRAGYSEDQIVIMEGLATETCYPIYEYNGEYVQISGSNPSGHPLTVFINSMCNSIYMRYAYYHIYPYNGIELFQDYVSLMTYGDDNIMSVSTERPEFNHTRISEVLADSDIKYTMADKTAISRPFIHLNETSFLKRAFVYSNEFKMYVAPIEELSLYKTLHSALVSKELTREQHSAQAIDCVLREWFFYGEEYFNEKRKQLNEIAKKHQLLHHFEDNTLHTYDSLKSSFINKYLTEDISPESDPLAGGLCVQSSSALIY